MTIAHVIAQARSGELSNLSETGFNDNKIMLYINLGLIELYKRFNLSTGEAILVMSAGKTIYKLDGTDPDVNLGGPYMYLISAFDKSGNERALNNEDDLFSVFTPGFNVVQIPHPTPGEILSLIYGQEPPIITQTTDILPIPVTLLEALLHYIGYRGHGAVNGNIQAENNTHYQRFEASVNRAQILGVTNQDDSIIRHANSRGFI